MPTPAKIRVGFTGSQEGMTDAQKQKFINLIETLKPDEFHHGDCIGSDADAHDLVKKHLPSCTIVIHPPTDPKKRAFKKGDVMMTEAPYLTRNKHIVDLATYLIATPSSYVMRQRSGTWSTVRYAMKKGMTPFVALPDGRYLT